MERRPLTLTEASALSRTLGRPLAPVTLRSYAERGKLLAWREATPRGPVWYVDEAVLRLPRHGAAAGRVAPPGGAP